MLKRLLLLTASTAVSIGAAGCGKEPWVKNRPLVFPASVTVLYNNEPVENAKVFFSLQGGSRGAMGTTDKSGRASMTTFVTDDGVVPGTHSVKIEKILEETKISDQLLPESKDHVLTTTRVSKLPSKYGEYKSSGLTADVTQQGPNEFVFELMGKVGPG